MAEIPYTFLKMIGVISTITRCCIGVVSVLSWCCPLVVIAFLTDRLGFIAHAAADIMPARLRMFMSPPQAVMW
jgi:hypothetical protein